MNFKTLILNSIFIFGISFQGTSQERLDSTLVQKQGKQENIVNKSNNLKISGYIQGQYQNGQPESQSLKVGDPINEVPGEKNISRMGIRRGRLKLIYEESIYSGVFQIDLTERGIAVKDLYFQVKDPWTNGGSLRAGIFNRPFGYEIGYSSSKRESPERAEVIQKLFPDERDLGATIGFQAPKTSSFHILRMDAAIVSGNGIRIDSDNRKDFIGHLRVSDEINNQIAWGAGFSYYYGNVYNPTEKLYVMDGAVFEPKGQNPGSYAKREYLGFEGQFGIRTALGKTIVRGEYLWGTQPGTIQSSRSPNQSSRPLWAGEVESRGGDGLFLRNFSGYYIHFIQQLGKSPFSTTLKYDNYDPNTKIKGSQVEVVGSGTSFADLAVHMVGFGGIWDPNKNIRVMAYYEINTNEAAVHATSEQGVLYNHDREDNVFTLRLQYKF